MLFHCSQSIADVFQMDWAYCTSSQVAIPKSDTIMRNKPVQSNHLKQQWNAAEAKIVSSHRVQWERRSCVRFMTAEEACMHGNRRAFRWQSNCKIFATKNVAFDVTVKAVLISSNCYSRSSVNHCCDRIDGGKSPQIAVKLG